MAPDTTNLGQETVYEDSLELSKSVHPEDALDVVGRVPGGVKYDDPVRPHQVDAQRARPCGDEEQTPPSSDGEEEMSEMRR